MTRGGRLIAPLCALVVMTTMSEGMARAEDAESGRRLFKRGQELLKDGDYRAAAHAFEMGYAAAPRAGFLLNIGNCYRKLGELGKAREHYWRFLDAAPKDHPSRPSVMEYLRTMEQIEADGVAVDGAPPRPAPAPTVEAEPAQPPSRRVAHASPVMTVPPPEERSPGMVVVDVKHKPPAETAKPSLFKRWWFWTIVGGAVAASAGAFVLTRRSSSPCSASLGCVHE